MDEVAAVVDRLASAMDELLALDLTRLDRDSVFALFQGVEIQLRRAPAVDHRLITETERRGFAHDVAKRDVRALLVDLVRVGGDEAARRVRDAERLAHRTTLAGVPVAPLYPRVAAAVGEGAISVRHARLIMSIIDRLPQRVQDAHADTAEAFLVEQALLLNPTTLGRAARRLVDTLDPDGKLTEHSDQLRLRELTLKQRADGSGTVTGYLTAQTFQRLHAVLNPLATPLPADPDGRKDPRSAPQRYHDALDTALGLLLRSGELPDSGGLPATVIVTMTLDQFDTRLGLARADTGALIPVADILDHSGDAAIKPIAIHPDGRIAAIGHLNRLATLSQRLALAARDKGCSAPGCTIPAKWSETNHVTPWSVSRRTSLDDLCLACRYHHDLLDQGWTVTMINNIPHWTAPVWLDPSQTPRRNTAHNIPALDPTTTR